MALLSTAVKNALNSASPNAKALGFNLGDELEAILTSIASGNLGIAANAWDVDAAAAASRLFARNEDSDSGLNFGYFAGVIRDGQTLVPIGAGTVALGASADNYVEVLYSGGSWAVSANQTAFTGGAIPLYFVVTGASSISTVTRASVVLWSPRDGGILGKLLSTVSKTKIFEFNLATISATASPACKVICPNSAGKVAGIGIAVGTTIAANDTNYWTFSAQNKGALGSGTTALLAATDANTTKATGGSGLTANVFRACTLHGTASNLDTAAHDELDLIFTKTAGADNLVLPAVKVEVTCDN